MRITTQQLRRIIREELIRAERLGALDEGMFGLGGLFGKGGPLRGEPADPLTGATKATALDRVGGESVPKDIWLGLISDPDLPGGAGFDKGGKEAAEMSDTRKRKERFKAMEDYVKWHKNSGANKYLPFSEYQYEMSQGAKAKKARDDLKKRDAERAASNREYDLQRGAQDRRSQMDYNKETLRRQGYGGSSSDY
jgi:hypothetical protein